MDVLDYYANEGDVQTCVTVCRALGAAVEEAVGQARLQQWLVQYIDLLHRLQLWSPASTVMARCNDPYLRRKNQEHTTVKHAAAGVGVCAVCLLPVKGVWTGCQACGHGGHLHHLRDWFAEGALCPTGCGHSCVR